MGPFWVLQMTRIYGNTDYTVYPDGPGSGRILGTQCAVYVDHRYRLTGIRRILEGAKCVGLASRGIPRGPKWGILTPDTQSLYARARTMIVSKMPFY